MAQVHGKQTVVNFNAVDVSAYFNDTGLDQKVDWADTTTFGAAAKTGLLGLIDNGTVELDGPYDTAIAATFTALLGSNTSTALIIGPAGTTTGLPKATMSVVVSGFSIDPKVTDATVMKITLQVKGAVTWSVY